MTQTIALVELQPQLPNLGSYLRCPTYGIPLLATILKSRGFDVVAFVEGLSSFTLSDLLSADVVCFSIMTASAKKTYALADQLRAHGKVVVFGGAHATFFPVSCMAHADYVVRGEGDETLPRLLETILAGRSPIDLPGVSYKAADKILHNPDAPPPTSLNTVADYSLVRGFAQPSFLRSLSTIIPVQSSRGCRHNCSFCVTPKLFGGTYRKRPIPAVIEEVKAARISRHIFFVDNDFVGTTDADHTQTWHLCQSIREAGIRIDATAFATVSVVQHPTLLREMHAAGIRQLCLGLESLELRNSLGCYRKTQTPPGMHEAISHLKRLGFSVFASFMAGINGEDADTVLRTVDISIRWGIDAIYFFVLSPYPSMDQLIPANRIILYDWDYASGHFLYFLPTAEKPSDLQRAVLQGTEKIRQLPAHSRCFLQGRFGPAMSLLLRRLAFRPIAKATRQYIRRLQAIEMDLYENGSLDERKLAALPRNQFVQWEQEDLLTSKETVS